MQYDINKEYVSKYKDLEIKMRWLSNRSNACNFRILGPDSEKQLIFIPKAYIDDLDNLNWFWRKKDPQRKLELSGYIKPEEE